MVKDFSLDDDVSGYMFELNQIEIQLLEFSFLYRTHTSGVGEL